MMHKTRAGIDWVRHPIFAHAKMLVGIEAEKRPNADNWFTNSNMYRIEALVAARLPGCIDLMRKEYNGNSPISKVLTHRASFCMLPENYKHGKAELKRFKRPDFASSFFALAHTDERLSANRLYDLQAQRIILETPGVGLYLRWNPDNPASIYVGVSHDQAARNKAHSNADNHLWTVYATNDMKVARDVEYCVHAYLSEIGEPVRKGTRGLYRVHSGNALQLVVALIDNRYGRMFHNTGGCKL